MARRHELFQKEYRCIRRTFAGIKTEIEQEIGADDIRRQLHNEAILKEIKESKEQIADALKDADQSVTEFKQSINETIDASVTEDPESKPAEDSAASSPADEKISKQ